MRKGPVKDAFEDAALVCPKRRNILDMPGMDVLLERPRFDWHFRSWGPELCTEMRTLYVT